MTYENWPATNGICHWSLANSHMSFKRAGSLRDKRGWSLSICSRSRPAAEELAAIGQLDGAAVCYRSSGLCPEARDFDLGSSLDRVGSPAQPNQSIGRAQFEAPIGGRAVRLLDVDVQPRMRIGEFNLRHRSVDLDRFVHVEFGGECM